MIFCDDISAKSTTVITKPAYKYGTFWLSVQGQDYAVFTVRTKNDAHIGLSEHPGVFNRNMYEIVIGAYSNTACDIRIGKQGEIKHHMQTPGILSDVEPRTFWVGWKNGLIEVGVQNF